MTIDEINKQYSGGMEANQAVVPSVDPSATGPASVDSLNKRYASFEMPKPTEVPKPAETPLFQKQDVAIGTPEAGFAPGAGGGSAFDFHVVTPKFSVKEVPALGNFLPTAENIAEAGKKTFNVVSQVAEGAMNTMNDLFDFGATFVPKLVKGEATKEDALKGAASALRFGSGIAGIAFSAISSELTAAETIGIPGVSQAAALTNRLFEKLGEGGAWLAGKGLQALPVSDEAKAVLMGPTQELGAMALPLVFAHATGPIAESFRGKKETTYRVSTTPEGETMSYPGRTPTTGSMIAGAIDKAQAFAFAPLTNTAKMISEAIRSRVEARRNAGEDVSNPDVARKIVNEAVKEVPAEIPAEMKIKKTDSEGIPTNEEPVRVYTNQKLVLQNFIKGQEDINYKVVPNIGSDPSGNKIAARFEWDYKNQRATMYVTKRTTASDLAHELGHYFDRKLSANIDSTMSQVLSNYAGNAEQVKGTLAAYAVDALKGDATAKQISGKVDALITAFKPQVERLSKGETRGMNDKFAEAVKAVILDPELARSKAPDFTGFIEYSIGDKGIISRKIKSIEGVVTTVRNNVQPKSKRGVFIEDKKPEPDINLVEIASSKKSPDEFLKNYEGVRTDKGYTVVDPSEVGLKDSALISMIKVNEDSRRAGEGTKLILQTLKDLSDNGIKTIEVASTPEGDALNKSLGRNGIIERVYSDDLLAQKKIDKETWDNMQGGMEVYSINRERLATEYEKIVKTIKTTPEGEKGAPAKPQEQIGPFYHGTSRADAESLVKNGFQPKLSKKEGQESPYALFTSTEKGAGSDHFAGTYGDTIVKIDAKEGEAIKILDQLKDPNTYNETFGSSHSVKESADWAKKLKEQGYDVIKEVSGETIILSPEKFDYSMQQEQRGTPAVTLYRGGGKGSMPKGTAEDVLNYEKVDLGNADMKAEPGIDLSKIDAKNTEWLTETKSSAKEYGAVEAKKFDANSYRIIARDGQGGVLVEKIKPIDTAKTSAQKEVAKPFTGKPIVAPAFNEAKINAPEDVIKVLNDVAEKNKQFADERRSTTLDEMKSFSLKYLGDEALYKTLPSEIRDNIGRMKAAEQTMVDLATGLRDEMKATDIAVATDAQIASMRDKLLQLEKVTAAFSGARTETSHLFASLKGEVSPGENQVMRGLFEEMKKAGLDTGSLDNFFKEKAGVEKKSMQETKTQAMIGVWYSFMLSGPGTFLKNVVSTAGSVIAEEMASAIRKPGDVPRDLANLFGGIRDGWEMAREVAAGRKPGAADMAKFTHGIEKTPYEFKGRAAFLNNMRVVGRLLAASDTVFNEGLRQMELGALRDEMPSPAEMQKLGEYRAKKEGFRGEQIVEKGKEYATKSPEILIGDLANQFALKGTYNNDPIGMLGTISRGVSKMTNERPAMKIVAPFTRVVANVFSRAMDFTPYGFTRLGTGEGTVGRMLSEKAADMPGLTARQRSQQLTRAITGTLFMAVGSALAASGNLSGNGPSDYNKKQQLLDQGWRPNSVKIYGVWVPYINAGPLALPLSLVANAHDALAYGQYEKASVEKRLLAGVAGAASSMFSMSFLSGANTFMDALSTGNPDKLKNILSSTVTGAVPNLFKQVGRIFDPTVYDTSGVWEAMLSNTRIAGVVGMRPKLNVFGEPVQGDRLTGLTPVAETRDPVMRFLGDNQLWITQPSKTTQISTSPKDKRQMTPDEYYRYVQETGPKIKADIAKKMDFIARQKTADDKQNAVNDIVNTIRKRVKNDIERDARK